MILLWREDSGYCCLWRETKRWWWVVLLHLASSRWPRWRPSEVEFCIVKTLLKGSQRKFPPLKQWIFPPSSPLDGNQRLGCFCWNHYFILEITFSGNHSSHSSRHPDVAALCESVENYVSHDAKHLLRCSAHCFAEVLQTYSSGSLAMSDSSWKWQVGRLCKIKKQQQQNKAKQTTCRCLRH